MASSSARDRSRSPVGCIWQEGDSEMKVILRLMDKISALECRVQDQQQTIKEKNEIIAELKVQIKDGLDKQALAPCK
jgi:hypothetical protein